MIPESRRRKLAMLTRSIAQGDFARAQELLRKHGHSGVNRHGKTGEESKPVDLDREEQAGEGAPTGGAPAAELAAASGPLPLAQACPGCETTIAFGSGERKYWLIRKGLEQVDPQGLHIAGDFAAVMRGSRQRLDELKASAALCHASVARPEDLLFMDIESCGLYGTGLFLIGMMSFQDDQLIFEQLLARDYAEEAAILEVFARRLDQTGVLVTFNGRTFDMNMIKDRSAFHAVEMGDRPPPHLDLLHESRRRWRGKLPNCRLQTLEKHLCGRVRYGDIPGWAIPDAYHRFVDSGDARQVADILHHNLLDMLTMAQLLTIILTNCDPAV